MYNKYIKRMLDFVVALLAIPFWLLILLVIGIHIHFEDHGPVFYNALRLGKDGKIFKMYKFRTMKVNVPDLRNEDGSTFNSKDDPRLTKTGRFLRKTSIDETPQVINVLLGDMSVIGPRPDLPEHRELYVGNEARKLEVRPGMSGYNQAYFRNTIPWKDRIQNDIFYIDHLTLFMDIKILLKTAAAVLRREDIYIKKKSNDQGIENSHAS